MFNKIMGKAVVLPLMFIIACSDSNNIPATIDESENNNIVAAGVGAERPNFMSNRSGYEMLGKLRAEKGNSLEVLKTEFSLLFGPLDEQALETSDFPRIKDANPSATHVLQGLLSLQDQLTVSEQQRLTSILLPIDDILPNQSSSSAPIQLRNLENAIGLDVEFNVLIDQAINLISEKSGWTLRNGILGIFVNGDEWDTFPGTKGGKALAFASWASLTSEQFASYQQVIEEFNGSVGDCLIFSDQRDRYATIERLISAVAHEVFHCFQFDISIAQGFEASEHPYWLIEGLAAWAQFNLYPDVFFPADFMWEDYEKSVFTLERSSYGALGFWSHVDNVSVLADGLWPSVVDIIGTNIDSTPERVAFIMDFVGAGKEGYDSWLPMASGQPQWSTSNTQWHSTGVGGWTTKKDVTTIRMPSDTEKIRNISLPTGVTVVHGELTPKSSDPKPTVFSVKSLSDLVLFAHWERTGNTYKLEDDDKQQWCKNGPCVCEDGSTPAELAGIEDVPDGEFLYVAYAPGFGKEVASIQISQIPIKDFCEDNEAVAGGENENETDSPGKNAGIIYGDPRLLTFDNYHYDFQTVGEFVLAESTENDFNIQARFSPLGFARTHSYASVVAMNVAGDVIQIDGSQSDGSVLVNGEPIQLALGEALQLENGGELIYQTRDNSNNLEIETNWPDNTVVTTIFVGYTLAINSFPADIHSDKLTGLLGDFDGDSDDEPQYPDGTPVYATAFETNSDDLYTRFAAAYRVTDETSLFTYDAGESTATFTDKTYPDQLFSLKSLGELLRNAARDICIASGVTELPFLESCILDFAATNDEMFVDAAVTASETELFEIFLASGGSNTTEGTASGSSPDDSIADVPGGVCPCTSFQSVEMNSPPWATTSLTLFNLEPNSCSLFTPDDSDEQFNQMHYIPAGRFDNGCYLAVGTVDEGVSGRTFLETNVQQDTACAALVESKARDWFRNGNPLFLAQRDRDLPDIPVTSESQIQCN